VGTLIDNGKLTNEIARLVAIVGKISFNYGLGDSTRRISEKQARGILLTSIVARWWNSNHGLSCCIGLLQWDLSGSKLVIHISCLKVKLKECFNSFTNQRTITRMSNYSFPITTFCNWIPVIGWPRDSHVKYVRVNGFLLNIAYFYLSSSCLLVRLEYVNPIME